VQPVRVPNTKKLTRESVAPLRNLYINYINYIQIS